MANPGETVLIDGGNGYCLGLQGRSYLDFRGLGFTQLHWMWTSHLLNRYIPITWMTFGLDYNLWGLDPFGYHLTNLLWHTANAVLFYDKHGWEARAAVNWRDHFLQYLSPPPLNGAGQAVTQVRARYQLDASATYHINKNFAVYAVIYALYFFPWRLVRRAKSPATSSDFLERASLRSRTPSPAGHRQRSSWERAPTTSTRSS